MVRILLDPGALVDKRATNHATDCRAERTPLMIDPTSGAASCLKLLHQYRAVHGVDTDGKTALARATDKGDIASMAMLLTIGSLNDAQSLSGCIASMTAARNLHGKDVDHLLLNMNWQSIHLRFHRSSRRPLWLDLSGRSLHATHATPLGITSSVWLSEQSVYVA